MKCTKCEKEITSSNCSIREKGKWRTRCLACENKRKLEWSQKNRDKRRNSQNKYARSIGIGINHPCEECGKPTQKKGGRAFCSVKCRFMNKVEKKESGCWEWKAKLTAGGYGVWDRTKLAHRVSFEMFKHSIPNKKHICHTCDNRKCVNPDHLWVGTAKENIEDAIKKNRIKPLKGENSPQAKLTWKEVKLIREKKMKGSSLSILAKEFNCSIGNISAIINFRSWRV